MTFQIRYILRCNSTLSYSLTLATHANSPWPYSRTSLGVEEDAVVPPETVPPGNVPPEASTESGGSWKPDSACCMNVGAAESSSALASGDGGARGAGDDDDDDDGGFSSPPPPPRPSRMRPAHSVARQRLGRWSGWVEEVKCCNQGGGKCGGGGRLL